MTTQRKQVDRSHYDFSSYMCKARWNSLWHQLEEIMRCHPDSVLEIGPGPGFLKLLARQCGVHLETLDLDPELQPDHVGSATAIPLPDASRDVVCAFQMLEHLPYEQSLQAFREMARVSKRQVIISLPDDSPAWRYSLYVPKFGQIEFLLPRPRLTLRQHTFDGEHHWEVNKRGYQLQHVIQDLSQVCKLRRTFRVQEHPYHRFFVFDK
jgi:Methyltransferase domain